MGKWEMVRLGDVGEAFIGLIYKPENIVNDGIVVLRSGNVQNNSIDLADIVRVDKLPKSKLLVNDEDILMCSRNGSANLVGKSTIISGLPEIMTFGAFMMVYRSKSNPYIIHFFHSPYFKRQLTKSATTTINQITKSMLDEVLIPLPPLAEQKRIAKNLDLASKLVKLYKTQISELDKLVQSVFYDMFGDPVTNEKGWDIKYIDELYKIIDGDRGTNYPKQEDFSNEEYCLFLNAGNVTKKGFVFENVQFITKSKDGLLRKGKLQRDDIILTTRGTVGNLAHYTENIPFDNIRINSGMVILRKFTEIEHNYFLAYFSNPLIYTSLMSGSAQPQLPITNMRKAKVLYPPLPLQARFAAIVTAIEAQKAQVQTALVQAQSLFNSLMQEYFE